MLLFILVFMRKVGCEVCEGRSPVSEERRSVNEERRSANEERRSATVGPSPQLVCRSATVA